MKDIYYSETSYIKSRTDAIRNEKLSFRKGERLGDLSLGIEDNATVRKVRRIIEKRVSQAFYKTHPSAKCSVRYATKRHTSNTFKNIYGYLPTGFRYCSAA